MNYDLIESPVGELLLVVDDENRLRQLAFRHELDPAWKKTKNPGGHSKALRAYFAGELDAITKLPLELEGTEFQLEVWKCLQTIPCGVTWSYAQVAAAIGRPTATRAVGLANGQNPIAIVVPCHRVIGSDGTLTGYGGGMKRKEWLLGHEGVLLALG